MPAADTLSWDTPLFDVTITGAVIALGALALLIVIVIAITSNVELQVRRLRREHAAAAHYNATLLQRAYDELASLRHQVAELAPGQPRVPPPPPDELVRQLREALATEGIHDVGHRPGDERD